MKTVALLFAGIVTVASAEQVPVLPSLPSVPLPVVANREIKVSEPKVTQKEIHPPVIKSLPYDHSPDQVTIITTDGLMDLYGGEENFGIAFAPDRIELVPLTKKRPDSQDPKYLIEGQDVKLKLDDEILLRSVLISDATFNWEDGFDWMPDYGFRVKFFQKGKVISVDLCFRGRTLRVIRDGQALGMINFEFGYDSLIQVVERYFPGTIAKVDEAREGR